MRSHAPIPSLAGLAALVCGTLACTGPGYQIDQFAVAVDLDGGPVPIAGVTYDENGIGRIVIDTASALTTVHADLDPVERRRLDLTLRGADATHVPRARFNSVTTLMAPLAGQIGVLGADVLRQVAVRFDLSRSQVFFFPDVAPTDSELAETCHAVFRTGLAGGGSYRLGEGSYSFGPTRVVVGACATGTSGPLSLQLVLATGVEPLILSASAYQRLTGAEPGVMDGTLLFPGSASPTNVFRTTVPGPITLAAHETNDRDPCCELCASRMAVTGVKACTGCADATELSNPDSPAYPTGAVLAIAGPVPVAVVSDTDDMLQGLRQELAPDLPLVDGFLGAAVLADLVFDVDYPNNRLIFRCAEADSPRFVCTPRFTSAERATELAGCVPPDAALAPDAGPDAGPVE